jgi:ribonuclease P protein component
LFAEGRSRASFPVVVRWLPATDREPGAWPPVRVAFAVPKRRWRRAVDRNRIKRLLRENWRRAKPAVYARLTDTPVDLVWIYTGGRLPAYAELEKAMGKALRGLTPASAGTGPSAEGRPPTDAPPPADTPPPGHTAPPHAG